MRRLAVLVVALVVAIGPAGPAAALDVPLPPNPLDGVGSALGCDPQAPPAEAPGSGVSGFFVSPPADPPGGDPFVDGAPSYAHYGMSGYRFSIYDLGCGPDAFRDPGATGGNALANYGMEGVKFVLAATDALLRAAYSPTYMQNLDGLLTTGVETLRTTLFDEWVPLSVALIGLMLLWRSRTGSWSQAALVISWALLVMVVASWVFQYPVRAGEVADGTVASTLGSVNEGINGGGDGNAADQATTSIVNAVLWQQWKMGTFGRANGATADEYAEDLYRAQTLTWAEAADARSDPDRAREILDEKADDWAAIASDIEESDPDAYAHLTGARGETRLGAAGVAFVAMLCTAPFLLVSALLIMASYLIIRLVVLFLPALVVIGVVWQGRGAVIGAASMVAAALLNTLMFGIGAAVNTLAARILLDPSIDIPLWLALALMFLLSFIMWVALRPMWRLMRMANPSRIATDAGGALGKAASSAKDNAWSVGKMAAASYVGNTAAAAAAADDVAERRKSEPRAEATPTPTPTAYQAPSPAPAPAAALLPGAAVAGGLPAGSATPPPAAPAPDGTWTTPAPAVATPLPGAEPATTTPSTTERVAPGSLNPAPSAAPDAAPIFTPGATVEATPTPDLPRVAEPSLDDDGSEIFKIFTPDEEDAR